MKNQFLFLSLILFTVNSFGQNDEFVARVMFYNVENLFDTQDDSLTADEEFTPKGDRYWSGYKLNNKLSKLSKVIVAAGKWNPPDIVGLCEIENREVLEKLISQPALRKWEYRIVHKESPDRRGIDVAILYNKETIHPISYDCFGLHDNSGDKIITREILYFSCLFGEVDTVHVFINHWPSRYRGYMETVEMRGFAARTLKAKTLELFHEFKRPKIIILGDFNDQPFDKILSVTLEAKTKFDTVEDSQLYNLSAIWEGAQKGTHKYQSQWSIFDQVIVSGALLNEDGGIYCKKDDAQIFNPSFLLEDDEKYGGVKPNRTYIGFKYHGGFSDHLPVLLDLRKR